MKRNTRILFQGQKAPTGDVVASSDPANPCISCRCLESAVGRGEDPDVQLLLFAVELNRIFSSLGMGN